MFLGNTSAAVLSKARIFKPLKIIYLKYLILNSNLGVPVFVTTSKDTEILEFHGKRIPSGRAGCHVGRKAKGVTVVSVQLIS